ncbi:TPA: aspartate kinase [bacterium]|nr:aspartate kinase [bacterium]
MLIVQKYGGSSLASIEMIKNVANRVIKTRKQGNKVVVVVSAMGDTTDELIEKAYKITSSPNKRELDMLISTGEQISSALLSMAIHHEGYKAISLTGSQVGIITDTMHTKARIKGIDTKRIEKELSLDNIVIVCGFQGITVDEDITTLGRGGSDTTAIALASVLDAETCEIYTDVDGVYTGDPRIVKKAKKLDVISYDEMLEMASLGSVVLNLRAVEFAKKYGVVIHLRSSFNDKEGTIICEEVNIMEAPVVSEIASDENCTKITIVGVKDKPGIAGTIFSHLADKGINVDMIVQGASLDEKTNNISFTVTRDDMNESVNVLKGLLPKLSATEVIHDDNVAKVSMVGVGMRSHPGVAAKMFSLLGERNINIHMISTSEIKISCIVEKGKAVEAVRILHSGFGLE